MTEGMKQVFDYARAKAYDELELLRKVLGEPYEKEKSLKWQLANGRKYQSDAEPYGA